MVGKVVAERKVRNWSNYYKTMPWWVEYKWYDGTTVTSFHRFRVTAIFVSLYRVYMICCATKAVLIDNRKMRHYNEVYK